MAMYGNAEDVKLSEQRQNLAALRPYSDNPIRDRPFLDETASLWLVPEVAYEGLDLYVDGIIVVGNAASNTVEYVIERFGVDDGKEMTIESTTDEEETGLRKR